MKMIVEKSTRADGSAVIKSRLTYMEHIDSPGASWIQSGDEGTLEIVRKGMRDALDAVDEVVVLDV